jgi:hypothetical protein
VMKTMMLETVNAWVTKAVPVLVTNAVGLSGVALVTFGISRIYEPAGYIFAGVCLIAIATGLTKKAAKT